MRLKPDKALAARASAAHDVLAEGGADGELVLSYVVWPTVKLEEATATARASKRVTPEQVERIFELHAAGMSWAAIAEEVLGSRRRKATVGTILRQAA
jgi:hypothetical protein